MKTLSCVIFVLCFFTSILAYAQLDFKLSAVQIAGKVYTRDISGTSGTCTWTISIIDSCMTIRPTDGVSGVLEANISKGDKLNHPSWENYTSIVRRVKVEPGVKALNCNSLFRGFLVASSIDINNLETDGVTDMSHMFEFDLNVTSLDLRNLKTKDVTSMENMFWQCEKLKSLDVSNFVTDNVTNMSGMFYMCQSLKTLDISSFNTRNVENMNIMFKKCISLQSINLSNFNMDSAISYDWMFAACKSLKTFYAIYPNPPYLKWDTFLFFRIIDECTLYVPKGARKRYSKSSGWVDFINIKEGINTLNNF